MGLNPEAANTNTDKKTQRPCQRPATAKSLGVGCVPISTWAGLNWRGAGNAGGVWSRLRGFKDRIRRRLLTLNVATITDK